jgi:hypothetical protein
VIALRELQMQFLNAVRHGGLDDAVRLVARGRVAATTALSVYQSNYTEGFRKALALEFPVIEQLVGADCFSQLAFRYQSKSPSRSGDLHGIGAAFSAFLGEEFATTQYAYLPDVAHLEWALECASRIPAQRPLDRRELDCLPADAYGDIHLTRQHGSVLVASDFPVVTIWCSNQVDATDNLSIDLAQGPEHAIVKRGPRTAEILPLSHAEFEWLRALEHHEQLSAALESALKADRNFDLTTTLHRFFQSELFVQLALHPPTEIH